MKQTHIQAIAILLLLLTPEDSYWDLIRSMAMKR